MKELFDIIYIQKMLYIFNDKYYIKDNDLSILFNNDIKSIIEKDKILKLLCIKMEDYYIDNECIAYIANLLNTNKVLIMYNKILVAFNLINKYSSLNSIKI